MKATSQIYQPINTAERKASLLIVFVVMIHSNVSIPGDIARPFTTLTLGPPGLPPLLSSCLRIRRRGESRYGVLNVIRDLNEVFGWLAKTRNDVFELGRDDEDALLEAAGRLGRWWWRRHAFP